MGSGVINYDASLKPFPGKIKLVRVKITCAVIIREPCLERA